jgi:ATP-dependent RNA helicase DeaD
MNKFEELWLSSETIEILTKKWYEKPSPIQEKTIPLLLGKSHDIIWQAQTWTWKTAAFWLPIIENLLKHWNKHDKSIKALILAPTRELAIQVWSEIKSFVWKRDLNVFTIYWWQSYITEKRHIKDWIDILVWTPWRIIDHMNNWLLNFDKIEYFVLDEADEMLNMWFIDDIENILKNCSENKTTLFFSATMPSSIMTIAKKYMKNYEVVSVKSKQMTTNLVDQLYYIVRMSDKVWLLCRIIDMEYDFYWIIFCRTKADVDNLMNVLASKWYNVDSIHGDISQSQREKTFNKFKLWTTKILIATDVAARWLDVSNLAYVINYSIPMSAEDYTHRIWRTWRAGKNWIAITFVSPMEVKKIKYISSFTKSEILKKDIPGVDQIFQAQIDNIKKWVGEVIDKNAYSDYVSLADELLKLDKHDVVLAAVLSKFLKDKLSGGKYDKIENVSASDSFDRGVRGNSRFDRRWDRGDRWFSRWDRFERSDRWERPDRWERSFRTRDDSVRLFVAKWKKDWYTNMKMVDFVSAESWIQKKFIDDMQVMDNFSFFSTSKQNADSIIKHFSNKKEWGKRLVDYAKVTK